MVHLSHVTRKTIALTVRTFVGKVMSLLFNMLSRFVIAFLPRNKCLLIHGCGQVVSKYAEMMWPGPDPIWKQSGWPVLDVAWTCFLGRDSCFAADPQ